MVDLHADTREAHLAGKQHVVVHYALGIRSGSPTADEVSTVSSNQTSDDQRLRLPALVQDVPAGSAVWVGRARSERSWRITRPASLTTPVGGYVRDVIVGETAVDSPARTGRTEEGMGRRP